MVTKRLAQPAQLKTITRQIVHFVLLVIGLVLMIGGIITGKHGATCVMCATHFLESGKGKMRNISHLKFCSIDTFTEEFHLFNI